MIKKNELIIRRLKYRIVKLKDEVHISKLTIKGLSHLIKGKNAIIDALREKIIKEVDTK